MLPVSARPVIVGVLSVDVEEVVSDDGAVGAVESNISLVDGSASPTTPKPKSPATEELSPPSKEYPQVMTEPSFFKAANADLVE